MLWTVVSIKDTVVGAFNRPFLCRGRGEAMRMFTDEVNRNDAQNPLFGHPKDFELWFLGVWDDVTCKFDTPMDDYQRLATGVDVCLTE